MWTSFYGGSHPISKEDCAKNAACAAECLFDCLVFCLPEKEKRPRVLTSIFGSLGVLFGLSNVK